MLICKYILLLLPNYFKLFCNKLEKIKNINLLRIWAIDVILDRNITFYLILIILGYSLLMFHFYFNIQEFIVLKFLMIPNYYL